MKLKNKKTGEIVEVDSLYLTQNQELYLNYINEENKQKVYMADKIASFNLDWEDYEEPKKYWYIDYDGGILCGEHDNSSAEKMMISMGNCFESLEEAEKAVEKLKAWKRLKDKGIKIGKRRHSAYGGEMYWDCPNGTGISDKQIWLDLDLLFGGKE